MEKGWAGAHGPGTAAGTSPARREDLAQDVLMYPKPSLTGAQGNLCCSPNCLWPAQDLPLPLCSPPLPATGSWWPGWAAPPSPALPSSQQGAFYFLLLTSLRNDVEPVCMKGRIKDNIRAVHSVLTGEIPAHGDTSLLTPPICIFSPLGNSGGQIKQVCSGLGQIKEPQTTISVYLSGSGIIH